VKVVYILLKYDAFQDLWTSTEQTSEGSESCKKQISNSKDIQNKMPFPKSHPNENDGIPDISFSPFLTFLPSSTIYRPQF